MKPFPMPVRQIGPGSHVEEEALQYLDFPRDMSTFEMPRPPERARPGDMQAAREILATFLAQLDAWDPAAPAFRIPRLDLLGMPDEALEIANQMLGEGEVAVRIDGDCEFRIQESVFAGLWRVCELQGDGRMTRDWLEAGAMPQVVLAAAREAASAELPPVPLPAGAMNSPALLAELQQQIRAWQPGQPAHVINLTLFPVSNEDHQVLEHALPVGPVAIMSRGFGNCRVTSTRARNVWRVQYFNNMNTLILNTLEVVELPDVAGAAVEDLRDSRQRLAELVEWMSHPDD